MINLSQIKNIEWDNKKIILVMVIFLAFVYLDYSLVIKTQFQNIKSIGPKITKLQKDIDVLNKDWQRMQEVKEKQPDKKLVLRTKKIISEDQIATLLQSISDIANKNEIKINQIKPVKETQAKQDKLAKETAKLSVFLINLDLLCDYHHLGAFINDLENMQAFITVQDIKITDSEGDLFKQKALVILKTYANK